MRGDDQQQNHILSSWSPEMRVRKDHPLRAIRATAEEVLAQLSRRFETLGCEAGRGGARPPSQAPIGQMSAQAKLGLCSREWGVSS